MNVNVFVLPNNFIHIINVPGFLFVVVDVVLSILNWLQFITMNYAKDEAARASKNENCLGFL